MQTKWYCNQNHLLDFVPDKAGLSVVNLSIIMPAEIKIELSGKNMQTDTKVDADGRIVQDKYIKIVGMSLGRHPIPEHKIYEMCRFISTNDDEVLGNFFGRPGVVYIVFDQPDPVRWHLARNSYLIS